MGRLFLSTRQQLGHGKRRLSLRDRRRFRRVARRAILNKKFSKELDRLQRQAEREFGSYEHRAAANESEIRAAFEFLRGRAKDDSRRTCSTEPALFRILSRLCDSRPRKRRGHHLCELHGRSTRGGAFRARRGRRISCRAHQFGHGEIRKEQAGHPDHSTRSSRSGSPKASARSTWGSATAATKAISASRRRICRNYTRTRTLKGSVLALIYNRAKPVKNFLRKYVSNVR